MSMVRSIKKTQNDSKFCRIQEEKDFAKKHDFTYED